MAIPVDSVAFSLDHLSRAISFSRKAEDARVSD
jgi:hypothetical protein